MLQIAKSLSQISDSSPSRRISHANWVIKNRVKLDFHIMLSSAHLYAQNLSRLAFRRHLERAATDLAIGRETLRRNARINHQIKSLTTKRAVNGFRNFHLEKSFPSCVSSISWFPANVLREDLGPRMSYWILPPCQRAVRPGARPFQAAAMCEPSKGMDLSETDNCSADAAAWKGRAPGRTARWQGAVSRRSLLPMTADFGLWTSDFRL